MSLSIIVPFYSVERYISECLDSIYRQDISEQEYEVICVDDCSPDRSLSIVESYASLHDNLKIIRNTINRKLGGARNAGLEVASGKYIMYIDSDDFIEDNVLGTLCDIAEKNDLDVLHFDYENYPISDKLRKIPSTMVTSGPDLFFDDQFIWYHDFITAWRKLYRRDFLIENKIAFAEHIMYEDNDYAIMVFAQASRVRHIQLNAYHYRNNPESITRIQYNAMHISYWMDLCHRLATLRRRFIREQKDERFQVMLEGFIRDKLHQLLSTYALLIGEEKKSAQKTIRSGIDSSLRPYVSKRTYYKLKLGIIN